MSDQSAIAEPEPNLEIEEVLEGASKATEPTASPRTEPRSRKGRGRLLVLSVLALGGLTAGGRFVHQLMTHEKTDDAYIVGSIHTVSSRLQGVVKEILVDENTVVAAGQPIVKLDSREFEIRCAQARAAVDRIAAEVEQAAAQLSEAEAQGKQALAQRQQAAAQLIKEEAGAVKAKADLDRASQLFAQRNGALISRSDLDSAKAANDGAGAAVGVAQALRGAAEAAETSAQARRKAAKAALDAAVAQKHAAEASLQEAELQLSYTTISAPVAGKISRKSIEVGDHLQPGQALFALVEPHVWIEANFKETQVARMYPGEEVELAIDAVPGRVLKGSIQSLSPATGAQFALLPPDNATGNFTKVVQRVPVKIEFAPEVIERIREQIRPGLSVVVNVKTR